MRLCVPFIIGKKVVVCGEGKVGIIHFLQLYCKFSILMRLFDHQKLIYASKKA